MNKLSKISTLLIATLAMLTTAAPGAELTPPSVQINDKFGVNLMNGQVNASLETVSIGGAMGLSHSISMYSNHLARTGQRGYMDKFVGKAKFTQLYGGSFVWQIMRVYDFSGSVDFRIYSGGTPYNGTGQDSSAGINYIALNDPRHKLVMAGASNEFLDWTKPDGTVARFSRLPNPMVGNEGALKSVTYPSGFTIYFDLPYRVYTNTGFSIAYIFEQDTRPPDYVADSSAPPGAPNYSISEWALLNPRYVKAVNNAVCSTGNTACLQRTWPTATFTWPAGMPRTMYVGERLFTVETPAGTTTYRYKPYDLAYNEGYLVEGYTPGTRISPRLYKIKPSTSTTESIEYTYKNLFSVTNVGVRDDIFTIAPPTGTFPTGMGSYETLIQDAGVTKTAKLVGESNSYEFGMEYMGPGAAQNNGSLIGNVYRVIMNVAATPPTITSVSSEESIVTYEPTSRNFPYQIGYNTGITETYGYTAKGNLDYVTRSGVTMSHATFAYENDCASVPKVCNQATSIFDAKNNETKFEYHAASGQVSRVVPPAGENGKRAEVRIDYQQLRARYYDTAGNRVEGAPIYMKVAERHCHDSNYTSADPGAGCGALGTTNDEVVTRYYYNHNNLLLTSVATTDWTGKTLRTCYQYDVYGNKVGETQPKGAAACN